MGLSCGGNFLKFLVFFFNAIVFLGGGVMAGYGIYLLVEAKQAGGTVSVGLPAFLTALGLLLFLIGFLGCFGACYNNTCMLKTFAIIIGILFIAEVICAIMLLVNRHKFVTQVEEVLKNLISEHEEGRISSSDASLKALYKIQRNLKCCGGRGPSDWTQGLPPSCCGKTSGDCTSSSYQTGCAQAMYDKVKSSALVAAIITLVVAIIQILAIICAVCLARKVNDYEKV